MFFTDPSVAQAGMLGGLAKQPVLRASQDDDSDRARQEQGQYTLLGPLAVRLDQAKDHYWADVPALGDNTVRVSGKILEQYADVLLTSGAWGTMEIEYDATYEIKGRKYPFDEAEASISVLKDYMQTGKLSRGDQEFSRNAETGHRPTGRHETRGVPGCGFPFLGDRVPIGGTVTRYADEDERRPPGPDRLLELVLTTQKGPAVIKQKGPTPV